MPYGILATKVLTKNVIIRLLLIKITKKIYKLLNYTTHLTKICFKYMYMPLGSECSIMCVSLTLC